MPTLARSIDIFSIVIFLRESPSIILSVFLLPMATGKCIFRALGNRPARLQCTAALVGRYFVCNRNLEWRDEWLCEK